MRKTIIPLFLIASAAFAQYKSEPAGAPPAELAPGIVEALNKEGIKVLAGNGKVFCEVWFRTSMPSGTAPAEEGQTVKVPQGALMGAIRFPANGEDRRGQLVKPGVYTLRFSLHPMNGDHLGVAPQRDFLLMVPASEDKDLNSKPNFDELVAWSRKTSGTPHPAVLSFATSSHQKFPDIAKEGDQDWALHVKIGDTPVSLIVVGRAEG